MTTTAIRKLTSSAAVPAGKAMELWKFLRKILTLSPADDAIAPRQVLSVSIERGKLSVACGSRFLSRIKIKGVKDYLFEADRYPQPEEVASTLALAVNEFGVPRDDVILSIPKAWVIIKKAEFPATIKENIGAAVSYEMDRLTPFMPEAAFYDFSVLNDTGEKISLLVMAAKADTIRPYIEYLGGSGFTVGELSVALGGIGTLCHYLERKADTLFVEIDGKRYEGTLFVDGAPEHIFSTDAPAGDEKERVDMISKEIRRFVDNSMTSSGRVPRVVARIRKETPVFKELFRAHMNMPVRLIGEQDVSISFPTSPENVPCAAVGSVIQSLWPKAHGLNLLKKGIREDQKTPLALTGILALALVALWVVYVTAPVRVERQRLQEINRLIESKKGDAGKVAALRKEAGALGSEIARIDDFKAGTMDLDILRELTSILPNSTWLTRVRITESTVEIEGYAASATELLPKLAGAKYMSKVEFASPTFRDRMRNSDRFNIRMEIAGVMKKVDNNSGDKSAREKK
jgi:Tfp pilus assembly protein PilN